MTTQPLKKSALLLAAAAVLWPGADARGEEKPMMKPDVEAEAMSVGFELGMFVIRDYRPIQGEKVRITFTLHASAPGSMKKKLMRRLDRYEMRVRDQVITSMRLAEPWEFEDPELRLIRRRLLLRLGRALPELPIDEVYFSDFRYLVE